MLRAKDPKVRLARVLYNGSGTCTSRDRMSWSDHRVRSSSGISGFGDLRRDYEDGFQRGVVPRREIGHVRRHVTGRMTSEDYTSQA